VFRRAVLGPLLFIFYINDVSKVIKYSRFHIYADDFQIYHSSSVSYLQRCYDVMKSTWICSRYMSGQWLMD
jgi:hypothetical protein